MAERQGTGAEAESGGGAGRARSDLRPVFLGVIALILGGWAVKGVAPVLMPLTAAVLIALAVMPVRDRIAARMPRGLSWLGLVGAMGVVLLVLAAFAGVLALAARQIVAEIPVGPGQVVEMIQGQGGEGSPVVEGAQAGASGEIAAGTQGEAAGPQGSGQGDATAGAGTQGQGAQGQGAGGNPLAGLSDRTLSTLRELGQRALGAAGGAAAAILNSAVAVLGGLVLVLFLTLLVLAESGDWRRKVVTALPWPEDWRLSESAEVIAGKVRAYLFTQALLGLVSALLYAAWLGFWGVGLLLVWPLLIFVLNFIPTIGSLVGGTLPVAYALITLGPGPAVGVGLGIAVIEGVMGNLVAPRVQGGNVALSPLVVLVALAFWGWTWGIAGALLAVPVTVALVVLGAHVPVLRPWALLLSNKTEWAGLDEATRPG
ncbi:AI-2E family transporter [Rubellimicrobium aerolatum]|uniref:AI-2E family transporter n=1 Tax=Rubellimicrobium aerolatum TaxID=490979 RepID=A0ABW0SCN2_9RHOB|nr:AI-2E family transporter [Rubellimicrobium aerolatum]MBP1806627.1 AI-2 transport protein TqsA [Rubellimicrobium aerolatum]